MKVTITLEHDEGLSISISQRIDYLTTRDTTRCAGECAQEAVERFAQLDLIEINS